MSQRTERDRGAVAATVLVFVLIVAVVVAVTLGGLSRVVVHTGQTSVSADQTLPPWPAPTDPAAGERAAGLTVLPGEGVRQHIHAHLDIEVDGQAVTVPEHLGIDVRRGLYAELHTHADSGVLHVESKDPSASFYLGQLFTEWEVKLSADQLGGLSAGEGRRLYVYVNGERVYGDPARIRLHDHQEILLAFGAEPPTDVPSSFDFAKTPT